MMCRAEFLALILMSLMVLHNAEGQEMEDAMAAVAARAQAEGDLSSQVWRYGVAYNSIKCEK